MRKAIVHYRDDLDLQNLMDYIQKEVPATLRPPPETLKIKARRCFQTSRTGNHRGPQLTQFLAWLTGFLHDVLNVT